MPRTDQPPAETGGNVECPCFPTYKAIMAIDSLMLLEGHLPPRALGLVAMWGARHQDELRDDWTLAEQRAPLKKIKPLE